MGTKHKIKRKHNKKKKGDKLLCFLLFLFRWFVDKYIWGRKKIFFGDIHLIFFPQLSEKKLE